MTKRRVTLSLDQDVVEVLEAVSGRSMSAVANEALRDALAAEAHRVALREWLDELDEKYGAPSVEQFAAADAFCSRRSSGAMPAQRGSSLDQVGLARRGELTGGRSFR